MSRFLGRLFGALLAFVFTVAALAGPNAVAQIGPGDATVEDDAGAVMIRVPLSQAVPWRVDLADAPPRVVLGFGDANWSDLPEIGSVSVSEAFAARVQPGWTDMALLLREPLEVVTAEMRVLDDGQAELEVRLVPTTADRFHRLADPIAFPNEATDEAARRLVVAIDPGHGGVDPGAIADDLIEADLMLAFARALKEALVRTGQFDAVLTREEDVFVSLEARLTRARAAGADVFLSLHADALEEGSGQTSGMTVYRLPDDAKSEADDLLATRHAADDLLKGTDLTNTGDDVALALLDIARRETTPRTRALQETLIEAFEASGLPVNSRPAREGAYSVLKSAEIPSVLIEFGFLSSDADRARLSTPEYRSEATQAVADALMLWQSEDRLRRARPVQ